MARKRYTEEQIIGVLKEAEAGTKVVKLCWKYRISKPPDCNWKTKYARLTVSERRWVKTREAKDLRLKQIVAEQAVDDRTLKELLGKDF